MPPGDVLYHGMPYQLILFAGPQKNRDPIVLIFIVQEIIELMREQNVV